MTTENPLKPGAEDPKKSGKTGRPRGRPKGSKSRRSYHASSILRERCPGYDPLVSLAELAMDETLDKQSRIKAASELACYIYPKRKAVEMTGDQGGPLQHKIKIIFTS